MATYRKRQDKRQSGNARKRTITRIDLEMTKEDFLIVNDLLTGYDFNELNKVEFFMAYEVKSNTKIPSEWFAETQLKEHRTQPDWESFRRETAKDFVVALVSSGNGLNPKNIAYSIEMTDELIKQLKEK